MSCNEILLTAVCLLIYIAVPCSAIVIGAHYGRKLAEKLIAKDENK
jgi:hypothetical protein